MEYTEKECLSVECCFEISLLRVGTDGFRKVMKLVEGELTVSHWYRTPKKTNVSTKERGQNSRKAGLLWVLRVNFKYKTEGELRPREKQKILRKNGGMLFAGDFTVVFGVNMEQI